MTNIPAAAQAAPLLEVEGLEVVYRRRRGLIGQHRQELRAVDGVSLNIAVGESLGLVGESGSGKSTIAQAVERLAPASAGDIRLGGESLITASAGRLRRLRRDIQMVFQDPFSSLDPSMTVRSSLAEPLRVHARVSGAEAELQLVRAIESVGLRASDLDKYPHEFSGGQRQRIAIARALITDPRLIVLDEAVSALDVSTRAQVLTLLQGLREQRGLAFLFIGHDLAVVRRMSDRIAVMYLGRIVEEGPAARVVTRPAHPYTAALLSAVPDGRRDAHRRRELIRRGKAPDPWNRPPGCAFALRCPFAMEVCHHEAPPVVQVSGGGQVECHLQTSGPQLQGRTLGDLTPPASPATSPEAPAENQSEHSREDVGHGSDA